jgi:hypothetical protein
MTATDRPPVLDDRSLFGHPRGLGLLFVVEMWERFSYYGMRGLLVLYLVNALKWPDGDAARLYGTYTGLVYLTPVIGGWLADRFLGTRRSLVVGGIIIALGHFTMAFGPGVSLERPTSAAMLPFYIGLLLVIIGTGFFKPNVSTMVGQIYREGDDRTYGECLARAREHLFAGRRVLVDERDAARDWGVPVQFLECTTRPELIRARLEGRTGDPSDADWGIYEHARRTWEPLGPRARRLHSEVDTSGTREDSLAHALAALERAGL